MNKAPYYACKFEPVLGETMVTCGGIITDGDQNALDKDFEPIPGLYVSGNDCGRRFGAEYITPIPAAASAWRSPLVANAASGREIPGSLTHSTTQLEHTSLPIELKHI